MRCLSCHRISIHTFCKRCQEKLLKPIITTRKVGSLEVYSFFKYQNIEDLLLTKHTPQGYQIYKALANFTFRPFIKSFLAEDSRKVYIIGVDEKVKSGYSHVALLTHALQHKNSKVLHAMLMANNAVKYAGKTVRFRLENPRDFYYNGVSNIEAILVDDIITTGTTLQEANRILTECGVTVLFALTLADVEV